MIILTAGQKKSISYGASLNEICQPLFKFTDITNFSYARIYNNGGQISLATRVDWLEHYFSADQHMFKTYLQTPAFLENTRILWTSIPDDTIVIDAKQKFDIDNGISLIQHSPDYNEVYNFGSTHGKCKLLNWYINNLDILERFILYFKDKAQDIIASTPRTKPNAPELIKDISELQSHLHDNPRDKLCKILEPKHVALSINGTNVELTRGEYRCVDLFMQGYTAKSIAKELGLSSRTVESYILHIKKKLNCHYKSDLIKIISASSL